MTIKSTVRQLANPARVIPLRDHQIVTDTDGTETLVCFGDVAAVRLPPYGDAVLPPDWHSAPPAVVRQRSAFLGMTVGAIRKALQYGQARATVSAVPIPLPTAWLDAYGPGSEDPYLGEDHPLPFIGTDGQRYDVLEARTVRDDLSYCP